MKTATNILVTGAGAPGIAGTIYSLRNNSDNKPFRIIATDIKDECIGKYLSEVFYRLPPPESPDYTPALKEIIQKEAISVVIPQTTREIEFLSRNKSIFKKETHIMVSDYEAIQRANDKYLIIKACEEVSIPYPSYFLVSSVEEMHLAIEKLGYPENKVVVKPRFSNGLRGVRIISAEGLSFQHYIGEKPTGLIIDLESFMKIFDNLPSSDFPELLVTEYMPGEEYSVDMFRSSDGDSIVIPRLRKSIRSGISFDTKVDLGRDDLIEYSNLLASHLGLRYCFGFQFKLDGRGQPKILECNPRVQGTMIASLFAGFNMIYYSVKDIFGEPVPLKEIVLEDGAEFKRYWGGVGIQKNGYAII